jgi:hypothetical protein
MQLTNGIYGESLCGSLRVHQMAMPQGRRSATNVTRLNSITGLRVTDREHPPGALAKWSWLKAWAMKIARQRGIKKAVGALARRLAVILHRIWVDGTEFRWTRGTAAA